MEGVDEKQRGLCMSCEIENSIHFPYPSSFKAAPHTTNVHRSPSKDLLAVPTSTNRYTLEISRCRLSVNKYISLPFALVSHIVRYVSCSVLRFVPLLR